MTEIQTQNISLVRWSSISLIGLVSLGSAAGAVLGITLSHRPAPVSGTPGGHHAEASASLPTPGGAAAGDGAIKNSSSPWQNRWRSALDRTSTPARDRELATLIEELARSQPQEALALAQKEGNWRLRDLLRNAALRGWASAAPLPAANWALTVRPEERRSAVEAVMQGAAADPRAAVNTALHLCRADPDPAGDYGHYTIAALTDVGAFKEAVDFGNQVGTDKFPFLLKSAFFQWSRNQPAEALAAVDTLTNPALRAQAYGEVISGWAWADARAVAEYALKLPEGDTRKDALAEALPKWVERDPVSATEWLTRNDSGPEFDAGFEALANVQSLVQSRPATAMELAGNIADPARRAHALRVIFRQWATNDATSAQQFIDKNPNQTDRALLLNELKDLFPE